MLRPLCLWRPIYMNFGRAWFEIPRVTADIRYIRDIYIYSETLSNGLLLIPSCSTQFHHSLLLFQTLWTPKTNPFKLCNPPHPHPLKNVTDPLATNSIVAHHCPNEGHGWWNPLPQVNGAFPQPWTFRNMFPTWNISTSMGGCSIEIIGANLSIIYRWEIFYIPIYICIYVILCDSMYLRNHPEPVLPFALFILHSCKVGSHSGLEEPVFILLTSTRLSSSRACNYHVGNSYSQCN